MAAMSSAVILPIWPARVWPHDRRAKKEYAEEVEQTVITLLRARPCGDHLDRRRVRSGLAPGDTRRSRRAADKHLYRAKAEGRNQVSLDMPAAMPWSAEEKHLLLDESARPRS